MAGVSEVQFIKEGKRMVQSSYRVLLHPQKLLRAEFCQRISFGKREHSRAQQASHGHKCDSRRQRPAHCRQGAALQQRQIHTRGNIEDKIATERQQYNILVIRQITREQYKKTASIRKEYQQKVRTGKTAPM